jgi:hypothetical protein
MSQKWDTSAKTVTAVSIKTRISDLRMALPNQGKTV